MNQILTYETACRFMWILQDRDGNEVRHSAGIGGIPESMKREAKEGGLEIWAEHYNLIGRVGKELGYVPLDNDVRLVEIKMGPRPELGRLQRVHYWLDGEWLDKLTGEHRDPWQVEELRARKWAAEFRDHYKVRTRDKVCKGPLHYCEEFLLANGFSQIDQTTWDQLIAGNKVEHRKDGAIQFTIERVQ